MMTALVAGRGRGRPAQSSDIGLVHRIDPRAREVARDGTDPAENCVETTNPSYDQKLAARVEPTGRREENGGAVGRDQLWTDAQRPKALSSKRIGLPRYTFAWWPNISHRRCFMRVQPARGGCDDQHET